MKQSSSSSVVEWHVRERSRFDLGLKELVDHRQLVASLTKRDLAGLYQQSLLGLFWRFFPTLFALGGYSLIFGLFGHVDLGGGQPYFVVLYCGLMPWMIFSSALTATIHSIAGNSALIKKAYFPRLVAPLVSVIDKIVDVVIGFAVLIILLVGLRVPLGPGLLLALLYTVWAVVLGFSIGLWLTWLQVLLRDVGHGVPVFLQLMFYLSPIVYPTSSVPAAYRIIFRLNPIVPVIDGMRWAVLGTGNPPGLGTWAALGFTGFLLIGGLWFFRRAESVLVDVL
jgi:lipopolysaccharide transport system permease protein